MKLPVGMARRALSYDDNLEAPMSTLPHDISINQLWRRPIIPERRFTHLAEVRHTHTHTHTTDQGDDLCVSLGGWGRSQESRWTTWPHPLQVTEGGEDQGLVHHREFSHHQYVQGEGSKSITAARHQGAGLLWHPPSLCPRANSGEHAEVWAEGGAHQQQLHAP